MISRNFIPEQTLLDKLAFDDTEALEELSRSYCYSLYAYCMSKLNSTEDAKRIVRNIFISLWEDRHSLPVEFSFSLYLYTQVRKAVVQCVNAKLDSEKDITVIEQRVIPGFSANELQKAKQPAANIETKGFNCRPVVTIIKRKKEEDNWWKKYSHVVQFKDVKHALKHMLNAR
jgi:DNA-directed RNA polymerase specialized sigma24 family protein